MSIKSRLRILSANSLRTEVTAVLPGRHDLKLIFRSLGLFAQVQQWILRISTFLHGHNKARVVEYLVLQQEEQLLQFQSVLKLVADVGYGQ